ncbi:MAG TPA: SHOCT domain-containing protein [Thermoplasmata archaeon]|nr:SHOCT domain-containing protein [Thermoplasmata archaeon]
MNDAQTKASSLWIWIVAIVVLGFGLLALFAAAMPTDGHFGMMGSGSWGWAVLMMAVPAIVLIAVLILILSALRVPSQGPTYPGPMPPPPSALDALDHRYARGELSREEYLRMRGDLTHNTPQS